MHGRVSHSGTVRPESLFHRLGKQHAVIRWSDDSIFEKPLASNITKRLRKIYRHLQSSADTRERHPLASEWFLDNYHVLIEAAAVSRESLVSDLYQQLPDVDGASHDGTPRVFLLACELIGANELRIDEQVLRSSLSVYQEHAPLTVAEIWALPIMLRLILLSAGASSMAKLLPAQISPNGDMLSHCPHFDMDEETIISRVIRALRLLAAIDWNAFFDAVSRLEAELTKDPAGVYGKMDFRTRDRYRKVIEELARHTRASEIDVARYVLSTAGRAPPSDRRRGHIGYYLVDRGRDKIEPALAFRPRGAERVRRWIRKHATVCYLSCIALAVSAFMAAPLWLLARDQPPLVIWLILALLALVPAWSLGMGLVQWLVTRVFPPDLLPRMDFSKGIADEARTIVAVPALLDNTQVTEQLLHDLEVRYLGNPDPNLSFVLLSDFVDAPKKVMPQDKALLDLAETRIKVLNHRYANAGRDIFFLLHRERRWSEGEKVWKGWERKRGKIVEFNRWILGEDRAAFKWRFGDTDELHGTRFVITLDADTMLPKGAAQALAGIMAHPLNAAEFDPQTKRVIAGYTVVQPRVEIDPASEESSAFTRIVAGDIG